MDDLCHCEFENVSSIRTDFVALNCIFGTRMNVGLLLNREIVNGRIRIEAWGRICCRLDMFWMLLSCFSVFLDPFDAV